ncbi:MAG: acyltransferase family protein [Arenicella sp.]
MSKPLSYRPELDGLRAIAVVLVLLYHAEISVFGSDLFYAGFIGVDIFFVISGYIISRIILAELDAGDFSFKSFYMRRIRRILPVLFTVMAVTFPFAWMFLLPREFIEYSKSILSSIYFGSNFFFYSATTEYGADSSLLKPFLHTWSLSIEEQFYILFPLLLFIAHKFPRWLVKSVVICGVLLSLKAANSVSVFDPNMSFYLLHTRAWEILVGVLVALTSFNVKLPWYVGKVLSVVGLGLIIAALILFGDKTIHPGYYTLLPVVGVALLIAFSSPDEWVGKAMSCQPLRYIGLISYSLYLWHFPIFAFARTLNAGLGLGEKIVCLVLSFILAIISYNFIEKPFRNKQKLNNKRFTFALLGLLAVPVVANMLVIHHSGYSSRLPAFFIDEKSSQQTWNLLRDENGQACHNKETNFCYINDNDEATVVIVGDSHMSTLQFDLFQRLKSKFNLLAMTNDACWFARGYGLASFSGEIASSGCSLSLQEERFEQLKNIEKAVVIIGGRLPLYLSNQYYDNQEGGIEAGDWNRQFIHFSGQKHLSHGIKDTVDDILSLGHEVILVYPFVEAGWHVPKKLFANMNKGFSSPKETSLLEVASTSFASYQQRVDESNRILDAIIHSKVHRVYPHSVFCNKDVPGRCITHNGDYLLYTDDDHLSQRGAQLVNDLIVRKIGELKIR